MSLSRHAGNHRIDDFVHDAGLELAVDERARRERAHAAGIRTAITVEDPFVILGRPDRHRARSIADREERHFGTAEALFDDEPIPGRAEFSVAHRFANRRLGARSIVGDDHALTRREAVGLQHDRETEFTRGDRGQRLVRRLAGLKPRGRNTVARHQRFREGLARFKARGRGGWTEEQTSIGGKSIRDAAAERQFGSDDREINPLAFGELRHGVKVSGIDHGDFSLMRDARITGRADERADVRFGGKPRDEGMLARAAADDENSHGWCSLGAEAGLHEQPNRSQVFR